MCQWLMPRAYTGHRLPVTTDDKVTMDDRSQSRASREPHLLLPWIRRGHWHQITAQDTDRHWFPLPQTRRCQRLTDPGSGHTQTLAFHYHGEGCTNVLRKHSPGQAQIPHLSAVSGNKESVAARTQPGAGTACYHGRGCV